MKARTFAAALLVGLSIVAATTGGHRAPARAVDSTPSTASGPVPADRQSYIADTPTDPYNNDQLALHVGAAGGKPVSHSYIHLGLDGLPDGASLQDATLTLVSNG